MLMGSTLPFLVAYVVGESRNVGRSVGLLYFVNTLGSAVACFIARSGNARARSIRIDRACERNGFLSQGQARWR